MKKLFSVVATVVLAVCALQLLYLGFGRNDKSPDAAPSSQAAAVEPLRMEPASAAANRQLELPRNVKQAVDFAVDEGSFADFTEREQRDQYLDWLLFTTVAALQSSAEEYNRILFDLPTSRQGYMRPVGNFEFGETRSRFIGNGQALALIPANVTAAQRKDFLASIADEQRKNLAGPFTSLIVVEYELDAERGRGTLVRRDDVSYATLFSVEYGYHEAVVTNAAELGQFTKVVPDLTAMEVAPAGLKLGGRKLLARNYRPIDIEQVATVWQSEQKIHKALDDWNDRYKRASDAVHSRWVGRPVRGEAERKRLESQYHQELEEVDRRFDDERSSLKLVKGSGFSLDPSIDFPSLKAAFDAEVPMLKARLADASLEQRISAVSQGLASEDAAPLRRLAYASLGYDVAIAEMLLGLERRHSFQAARYDGDLQGTEVGMVLFYTDLLAKLWAIDYKESSPRHRDIRDFVDHPSIKLSQIYDAESDVLNKARLWFGYTDLGFQRINKKDGILFARNVTRIYSAGSTAFDPGAEGEVGVFLGGPITWWNDHYEEVAQYEPEYERLNQIMKWSVAIGWLNDIEEAARLGYLAGITVDRSKVFPTWAAARSDLRFRRWQSIGFYPAGYKGSKTEALPRLSGPVTSGGVSLASKEVAKRAPIAQQLPKEMLRSNIDYAASSASKGVLKGLDGSMFTLAKVDANLMSTVAKAKPDARFRGAATQLAHADVKRTVAVHTDVVRIETQIGSVPRSGLDIQRVSNGFQVGSRAREVDRAESLARSLSASKSPDSVIRAEPMVESAIKTGETSYVVKLQGSQKWVKLAAEEQPSVDIASGWQLRASGSGRGARRMQASVVDEAQLQGIVAESVVIEATGGRPVLRLVPNEIPAGARTVEVEIGGTRLSAWVEPPAGPLHMTAREGGQVDAVRLVQRLGPDEIGAIRTAAANDNAPSLRLPGASQRPASLPKALEDKDFRAAAQVIAEDPASAHRMVDAGISIDLQRNAVLLQTKGLNEALHDLDRLIVIYGKRPDLMLRRGLVQIERGNAQLAGETALAKLPGPMRDRKAFFDELNQRLASTPSRERDLRRYAEYADWNDVASQPGRMGSAGTTVRPMVTGGRFDFEAQLAGMPPGQPLSLADVSKVRPDAIVYRQSSTSLNAVDWAAPADRSLGLVVTGDLGKVVRLSSQDIAHFRPAQIWTPEHAVPFKGLEGNVHNLPPGLGSGGYQACNLLTEACSSSESDRKQSEPEVYLVVAE